MRVTWHDWRIDALRAMHEGAPRRPAAQRRCDRVGSMVRSGQATERQTTDRAFDRAHQVAMSRHYRGRLGYDHITGAMDEMLLLEDGFTEIGREFGQRLYVSMHLDRDDTKLAAWNKWHDENNHGEPEHPLNPNTGWPLVKNDELRIFTPLPIALNTRSRSQSQSRGYVSSGADRTFAEWLQGEGQEMYEEMRADRASNNEEHMAARPGDVTLLADLMDGPDEDVLETLLTQLEGDEGDVLTQPPEAEIDAIIAQLPLEMPDDMLDALLEHLSDDVLAQGLDDLPTGGDATGVAMAYAPLRVPVELDGCSRRGQPES